MTRIERPSVDYKASFIAGARELKADGHHNYVDLNFTMLESNFAAYVQRELDREKKPARFGWVSDTVYWGVDDQGFIGTIKLRHWLTDSLREYGGHIGYEVRPSRRKEGHGTRMLALVLPEARQRGLERVMLTCDDDNIGSQRIIQANGGVYERTVSLPYRDKPTMYWWIDLTP